MQKEELLKLIKGKLIVSCQALEGEPLYDPERSIMPFMAEAAKRAGTPMIRTNSVRDVIGIREKTGLPIIGIIKKVYEGYEGYITSTMEEVDALTAAGTEVIALDCTNRKRGDGLTPGEYIEKIKEKYPKQMLMADISNYEEGVNAARHGIDIVSTTMSGYTAYTPKSEEPDYELVRRLSRDLSIPVIAEGRIHTPKQVKKMLELGAYAVIVGGAITRPLEIAKRFMDAAEEK
ncbi:MAG: N-acetylmannosamine-6-phosphate 2-epimerase [Lachnospiraceae bacterium]|nr:N-acetylmannosamine-6-phosphate 2-epimerase [Lachnospiraceae bacterium]